MKKIFVFTLMVVGFSFTAAAQINPATPGLIPTTPGVIPDTVGSNNNTGNYNANNSIVRMNSNDNTGFNLSGDTTLTNSNNSWMKKEEGVNSSPLLNGTGVNFNDTGIK